MSIELPEARILAQQMQQRLPDRTIAWAGSTTPLGCASSTSSIRTSRCFAPWSADEW